MVVSGSFPAALRNPWPMRSAPSVPGRGSGTDLAYSAACITEREVMPLALSNHFVLDAAFTHKEMRRCN